MIINKNAYERGVGHGAVDKSYIRERNEVPEGGTSASAKSRYRMMNQKARRDDARVDLEEKGLDTDGLPFIGKKLEHGTAEQCIYDTTTAKPKYTSFKDSEPARVENVRLMGDEK